VAAEHAIDLKAEGLAERHGQRTSPSRLLRLRTPKRCWSAQPPAASIFPLMPSTAGSAAKVGAIGTATLLGRSDARDAFVRSSRAAAVDESRRNFEVIGNPEH
jgi:hypothetical protein